MTPQLELHFLFRALQQRNRFVVRDRDTGLGMGELFLLLELDSNHEASQSELAKALDCSRSTITRALQRLHQLDFLMLKPKNSGDARTTHYALTSKGRALVDHNEKISQQRALSWLKALSTRQVEDLVALCRAISDGAGVATISTARSIHPFRIEMRRLTRAFGILKPYYMNSRLNSSQYQFLSEIRLNQHIRSAKDLVMKFNLPQSNVAAMVKKLTEMKLLSLSPSGRDGRRMLFLVTPDGDRELDRIELQSSITISKGLEKYPSASLRKGIVALRTLLGTEPAKRLDGRLREGAEVILHEKDLQAARIFIVRQAVKQKRESELAEYIASARNSIVIGLYKRGELTAVAEFEGSGAYKLRHFFLNDPESKLRFKQQALELLELELKKTRTLVRIRG